MKLKKPLWRISVATTAEAEDAVGELVANLTGGAAVAYFHLESQVSHVSVFLEEGGFNQPAAREAITSGLAHIRDCGLDIGRAEIEIARVRREDWAESWKRHFKPMVIGVGAGPRRPGVRSLLVKPSWSRQKAAQRQAVVILDSRAEFWHGPASHDFILFAGVGPLPSAGRGTFIFGLGHGIGYISYCCCKAGLCVGGGTGF